jgi:hypothetical protein
MNDLPVSDHRGIKSLLYFLVALLPVCGIVFLVSSGFLASWHGQAVSMTPTSNEEGAPYRVLIASDGDSDVRTWPASAVEGLALPRDPLLLPPVTLSPTLPVTSKERFQLHFMVETPDSGTRVVPTTHPGAVGLAVLLGGIAVFLRNMYMSGSPFQIEPRDRQLPKSLPPAGQPVPVQTGARGQKSVPPPRGSRGRNRRHR